MYRSSLTLFLKWSKILLLRCSIRRRKRYPTGTEVSEHLTFLEGEDPMRLTAHRGAGALHPCHEHRQLLCSDPGGGGAGGIVGVTVGVTQSPTYTRCAHRSRTSTTPLPPPPLPHPLCCEGPRLPGSGHIACACALLWPEALYIGEGGRESQHRSLDSLQAFDSIDCHNHHHHHHFCCDSHRHPHQGDSCCCCGGRGHPKDPDSLSSSASSSADRCVDFAARLSVRGVLGLRESRSPVPEDLARSSRGRSSCSNAGQTTCPHGRPQPNRPPSPDGDWAPFEGQSGGAKKAAQGVNSSVTSVRDVTVASGNSGLTDAENSGKKTNNCNSHVTKADDGPVEPSNPDLVSAAIGTQQQQQQLNGYV